MRTIGLDIGERRVGVAVSDPSGRVATPLVVLDARALAADVGPLRRIVEDYEAGLLVAGLPYSLSGEEGPQAAVVRTEATRLAAALRLPLEFVDERLSSAHAERSMRDAGATGRRLRGSVDMVAAAILLQGYLDSRASHAPADGENA